MCIVALILGMLMFHMLKNVCGCKTVEGVTTPTCGKPNDKCDTDADCCSYVKFKKLHNDIGPIANKTVMSNWSACNADPDSTDFGKCKNQNISYWIRNAPTSEDSTYSDDGVVNNNGEISGSIGF